MIKEDLGEGIIRYVFGPAKEGQNFANTIIAIVDEEKAILLDLAFLDQASEVIKDLESKGITVESAIASHFHYDHVKGATALPKNTPIYGSELFDQTLNENDQKIYAPTILVTKPQTIIFGKHKIELIPFGGHSVCSLITKINDKYIHIADEIMRANSGELLLPVLNGLKEIKRQIKALEELKKYSGLFIIPAHGPIIEQSKLEIYIKNITIYLQAVLDANGEISYEEAIKGCDCIFLQENWHSINCRQNL